MIIFILLRAVFAYIVCCIILYLGGIYYINKISKKTYCHIIIHINIHMYIHINILFYLRIKCQTVNYQAFK